MIDPIVTEVVRPLVPVTPDPFIGDADPLGSTPDDGIGRHQRSVVEASLLRCTRGDKPTSRRWA